MKTKRRYSLYGPFIFRTSKKPEIAKHHEMTDEEFLDLRVFSHGSGFDFNISGLHEAIAHAFKCGFINEIETMGILEQCD
jgi:hypothetical protein